MIALIGSLYFIPGFFSSVSYDIAGANFGGNPNSESQITNNIVKAQFPSASTSSGNNSIILVIQATQIYSNSVKSAIQNLSDSIASDKTISNYTGMQSVFTTETGLLNSTAPNFVSSLEVLFDNISSINKAEYALQANLSSLHAQLFQLQNGVNNTAALVYGVPNNFVVIWEGVQAKGVTDPYQANMYANSTIVNETNNFGGNVQSLSYYSIFYKSWNASFAEMPNSTSIVAREEFSINQSLAAILQSPNLDSSAKMIFSGVGKNLNTLTWNDSRAISNLTMTLMVSNIPNSLTTTLGISPSTLISEIYNLGPEATNSSYGTIVVSILTNQSSSNPTAKKLINDAYSLGASPSTIQIFNLSSKFFANATASSFVDSPLFTVNSTALDQFLLQLGPNATALKISNVANSFVNTTGYHDFPFKLSSSLTNNFVSKDNGTMLVLLNFGSNPRTDTIHGVRSEVQNSQLSSFAKVYITGSPVITEDVSNVFAPALEITVAPGIGMSLLIVALLFLAPLAAFIPVLIGGISVVIAYAAIYLGLVEVAKSQPSFLTPTLTTLLMLGLAVDYSVLQLRRVREERLNGRSKEESVAISVKWAGQAVLTAGITVVVAYIVMAVANVPLFSDVGTSIALGVSILLTASLTLLPSLELAIGDKMFWPYGLRSRAKKKGSMLERITNHTIRRKMIIAGSITAIAAIAFVISYGTPTGIDFLKLLPNFPSNEGLTVLTSNLGSSTIAPVQVVIQTSSPIVYGHNQFNQTLLVEIEKISSAASSKPGVTSVSGPTRPYGKLFNYAALQNMSEPIYSEYLAGVMSHIGKNNETALVLVGLSNQSETAQAVNSLLQVQSSISKLSLGNGLRISYGGDTQATYDTQSFIDGILPRVVIILSIAVYIILFLQLRSAFTPLRLVFTILCSVTFALALLAAIFYYVINLPILDFAPLFVVVTMLGVGIDYDIFFVTRIREEVLNGKTDDDAIRTAVSKIWVTILGLGLVLATVFGSIMVTGIPMLSEIGFTVSSAVMIDVGVVILFFVPALMSIAERFNWWPSKAIKQNRNSSS